MKQLKWTQVYRVGQRVEFSAGCGWAAGRIVRKTQTGIPIVATSGGLFAADRKRDIRAVPSPADPWVPLHDR